MTPAQRDHRRGTLYMLLVIAIWGGFLPVAKAALVAVDPYWLTAMRFTTAALVFLVLLWKREGAHKISTEGKLWKIALFGSCGFAGFGISLFEGLRLTRPEISAMILALGPIQVALWQWWSTHRRPDNFTLAAIALAANPPAPCATLAELKGAATQLKRDTGLNLQPTLTRLAQSRHLAGGLFAL